MSSSEQMDEQCLAVSTHMETLLAIIGEITSRSRVKLRRKLELEKRNLHILETTCITIMICIWKEALENIRSAASMSA